MSTQHAVDTSEQRSVDVLQVWGHLGARHPGRVADGCEVAGEWRVRGFDAWDVGSVKGRPIAMVLVLMESGVWSRWPSSLFMLVRPVE